jgi:hypothetical protein
MVNLFGKDSNLDSFISCLGSPILVAPAARGFTARQLTVSIMLFLQFCIGVSVGLGGYYLEEIKMLVRIVGWTREDMVLNWYELL